MKNDNNFFIGTSLKRELVLKQFLSFLKRMHNQPIELSNRFFIWEKLEKYESLALSKQIVFSLIYVSLRKKIERWRGFTEVVESKLTFCHNDLVPENILWTQKQQLFLIDWEYAGMNDPVWDLSSFFQEASLSRIEKRKAQVCYYKGAIPSEVEDKIEMYEVLANLLWYLWSELMVAAGTDYFEYGMKRLFRAMNKMQKASLI